MRPRKSQLSGTRNRSSPSHSAIAISRWRRYLLTRFPTLESRTFGDPPMWGDTIAIDAKASAGRHRDEAVVVKFTEPALHRSCRFRAEIGGGVAVGSENPSIVQAVYPQIASQNDVQRSRAE